MVKRTKRAHQPDSDVVAFRTFRDDEGRRCFEEITEIGVDSEKVLRSKRSGVIIEENPNVEPWVLGQRPPLGLRPKRIWELQVCEERLKEVGSAIRRASDAGSEIKKEWLVEYQHLRLQIQAARKSRSKEI